ncbi:nucleotide sugar dehydrogenase [Bacillus sp. DNRA2]|uniref:nucleotide sugar dehydrogenase n=1 Tax=Bacillus sp. DNRA2 TaxID=2723053 RepID=UPI00145FBA29|nr:nucleotide sugar dehydrogenase [Bacillus sp. DNRA2]NMD70478.1 nucleotide sugar dehydrogenase [Bacillus sp. DNRA2]
MIENTKIAIIGLGFVGLPLAILFAGKGYKVYGFDVDPQKIQMLNEGTSYITDVSNFEIQTLHKQYGFEASLPSSKIQEVAYIIVTVPTPFDEEKMKPDLTALVTASKYIAEHLASNQTVIFESSTYPGTLEEVVLPILTTSGLTVGKDFFLGYSPERIDPGNLTLTVEQIPKVVSGLTHTCKTKVHEFYSTVFQKTVPVSSPKVAEMTKLFENIQRLINISLVNELQLICEKMGIDFREAIDAASTKPFGFTPYYPGPGIGGHCIPVDPLYFQWKASHYGQSSKLIQSAHKINQSIPLEIINKINSKLANQPNNRSVLLLGLTYKKNIADLRESPAMVIFKKLVESSIDVQYHDPFIPTVNINDKIYHSMPLTTQTIKSANIIVVLTDHTSIDWQFVSDHAQNIIDTRGVIRNRLDKGVS